MKTHMAPGQTSGAMPLFIDGRFAGDFRPVTARITGYFKDAPPPIDYPLGFSDSRNDPSAHAPAEPCRKQGYPLKTTKGPGLQRQTHGDHGNGNTNRSYEKSGHKTPQTSLPDADGTYSPAVIRKMQPAFRTGIDSHEKILPLFPQ
jgi:hypothetical protein